VPDIAVGTTGDWYIDQDTNTLYGAKQAQLTRNAFDTRSGNSTNTGVTATTTGNVLSFPFAGTITHLWHERSASSPNASHTLRLWDNKTKALLATVATAGESGGGKVSVALPTPYAVKAGDVLMVTCDYPNGDANIYRNGTPVDSDDPLMRWGGSFYTINPGTFPDTANVSTVNFFQDVTYVNAYWSPALSNEFYAGPSAPTIDTVELWYDTDEPTVSEVLSQSLPKGFIGKHELTTAFVTVGTHTTFQDEGLTLTINEPVGRQLKITAMVIPYASGGVQAVQYALLRNGVNIRQWGLPSEAMATGFGHHTAFQHVLSGSVGGTGVVYKLQIRGASVNTAVNSHGAALEPRSLLIEDIGSG